MDNVIKHIVEPKRLLLTWQSIDEKATRSRFAVGELRNGPQPSFRYFSPDEFQTLNGKPLASIQELGYEGYPAFREKRPEHIEGVLDAFLRRLPPRKRTDFARYQQHFRLPPDVRVSDFALLALTEAKLPSDGFALVDPLDDTSHARELLMEVVGHRHYAATCDMTVAAGARVDAKAEPDNPHDANAVVITWRNQTIGYVNRFQTKAFHTWIAENRVIATIDRLNGEPDHPRVYLFVTIAAKESAVAA